MYRHHVVYIRYNETYTHDDGLGRGSFREALDAVSLFQDLRKLNIIVTRSTVSAYLYDNPTNLLCSDYVHGGVCTGDD